MFGKFAIKRFRAEMESWIPGILESWIASGEHGTPSLAMCFTTHWELQFAVVLWTQVLGKLVRSGRNAARCYNAASILATSVGF